MSKQEVKDLMLSASSRDDWNSKCDQVKRAFNGQYPEFWYGLIILSDVFYRV